MTCTRVKLLWLLGLLGLAPGCSSEQYLYVPSAVEERVDQLSGTAIYPIPVSSPEGNARVQSKGIVDLKLKNGNETVAALHVRVSISNQGNTPWSFDVREQRVDFPNRGSAEPIFANTDSNAMPGIVIQPKELRSVDLYFPLPAGKREASKLPEFDFRWQIHVGAEVVARATSFMRYLIPDPAYYAWGPYPADPYWSYYRS